MLAIFLFSSLSLSFTMSSLQCVSPPISIPDGGRHSRRWLLDWTWRQSEEQNGVKGGGKKAGDISQLCKLVSNPQPSHLLRTVSAWKWTSLMNLSLSFHLLSALAGFKMHSLSLLPFQSPVSVFFFFVLPLSILLFLLLPLSWLHSTLLMWP